MIVTTITTEMCYPMRLDLSYDIKMTRLILSLVKKSNVKHRGDSNFDITMTKEKIFLEKKYRWTIYAIGHKV